MKFGFGLAFVAAVLSGAAAWTVAGNYYFGDAERVVVTLLCAFFLGLLAWCQADRALRFLRWLTDFSLSAWLGALAGTAAGASVAAIVVLVPYGIWPHWWVLVSAVFVALGASATAGFLTFLMALICLEPLERKASERWRSFQQDGALARLRFRRRVRTVGLELNVLYQIERRFACEDRVQHENLACMAFSYRKVWLAQSRQRWGRVGYPVAYACSLLLWRCAPGFIFTLLRQRRRLVRLLRGAASPR